MSDTKTEWRAMEEQHPTPIPISMGWCVVDGNGRLIAAALDRDTAHRIAAVNELEAALQNFVNGVSTGAVRVDSDEDERLADAWRKIHAALAKARGEQ